MLNDKPLSFIKKYKIFNNNLFIEHLPQIITFFDIFSFFMLTKYILNVIILLQQDIIKEVIKNEIYWYCKKS